MRSALTTGANRFSRHSPTLIAAMAMAGLVISIFFLFWAEVGSNLAARADVSAAVATMFALFAAIAAVSTVVWISTSDYKAEQAVKADTARLRAALRSIMIKGAWLSQKQGQETCLDFTKERETINEFLTSTTAFGYWSWVEERGESTAVGTTEPWRAFFLYISRLLDACEPGGNDGMICCAVQVEKMLAELKRGDVNTISSYVADLADVLGTASESKDVVLSSVASVCEKGQMR